MMPYSCASLSTWNAEIMSAMTKNRAPMRIIRSILNFLLGFIFTFLSVFIVFALPVCSLLLIYYNAEY